MQDWKTWDQMARVEKAGTENAGPNLQVWKSQDWNMHFGPVFSCPAVSTPAIWSHVFQFCCLFHSRVFNFSVAPFRLMICLKNVHC